MARACCLPTAPMLLVATLAAADQTTAPVIPPAYATQALALAPAGTARPAALSALHAFVRDRIAEVPTKFS